MTTWVSTDAMIHATSDLHEGTADVREQHAAHAGSQSLCGATTMQPADATSWLISDGDPCFACRSLFEKDKLLFAFGLASGLQVDAGAMNAAELRFLLTGGVAVGNDDRPNPCSTWLSDKSWGEICRASQLLQEVWQVRAPQLHDWGPETVLSIQLVLITGEQPQGAASVQPWCSERQNGQLLLQLMLQHDCQAVCAPGLASGRSGSGVRLGGGRSTAISCHTTSTLTGLPISHTAACDSPACLRRTCQML